MKKRQLWVTLLRVLQHNLGHGIVESLLVKQWAKQLVEEGKNTFNIIS